MGTRLESTRLHKCASFYVIINTITIMRVACGLVLIIAISCVNGTSMPGGLTQVRDATPEVQDIANHVSDTFHEVQIKHQSCSF